MKTIYESVTERGIRKKVNQDTVAVRRAGKGNAVTMALVADGMGGLEKGELASALLSAGICRWFDLRFRLFRFFFRTEEAAEREIRRQVGKITERVNRKLVRMKHYRLGTTLSLLFLTGEKYLLFNIGDSRIYLFREGMKLLTKDQTYVQTLIDRGMMTEKEAGLHPKRNVLTECIGLKERFFLTSSQGRCRKGDLFFLCSDGFRHKITEDETGSLLKEILRRKKPDDAGAFREDMRAVLLFLAGENRKRGETDDLSAVLVYREE